MVTLGSGACRSFNTYCTDKEDCEGGNDADIEACEVGLHYQEDIASRHGCGEYFGLLQDCIEDNAKCDSDFDVYGIDGDDCEEESIDYSNCMGS